MSSRISLHISPQKTEQSSNLTPKNKGHLLNPKGKKSNKERGDGFLDANLCWRTVGHNDLVDAVRAWMLKGKD